MWQGCLVLLLATLCSCEKEPVLHWRTGVGSGAEQEGGHDEGLDPQEFLLPVSDARWGPLLGTEQILITLGSLPTHELQTEINTVLEVAGGQVINYIPDHSFLAIGHIGAVDAVRRVPGVVWAGRFHPKYKISPEWDLISKVALSKRTLKDLLNGKKLNGGEEREGPTGEEELIDSFFGELEIDTSGSGPRFVIEVQFPHFLIQKKNVYKPAKAASNDWNEEAKKLLGSNVEMVAKEHGLLEVLCPPKRLQSCLSLLANQPAVHWLHPKTKSQLHNWRASGIIQSGEVPPSENEAENSGTHPIWSAGIRGEGQIVGCGDSGIDVDSCFFYDPAVNFKEGIRLLSSQIGAKKQYFESEDHRKIRYYQGTADLIDLNGHGSHVVGSILGKPYYSTDPEAAGNQGMAPEARIAFMDLGGDDSRSISTPRELSRFYYPNTYKRGARIHSDSWGSDSPVYDVLSAEVDKFTWENQDFLPVFAAGNYGELSQKFLTTVTSPALAKNCLAVGATLTADQALRTTRKERVDTYEIEVEAAVDGGGTETRRYKILEAWFGGSWSQLIESSQRNEIRMIGADPKMGCKPLTKARDHIVLMQRGDCRYATKLRNAEIRGAAGVIVTNHIQQGYFEMIAASNVTVDDLTIPMGSVPISIGRELWEMVESKRSVVIRVSGRTDPKYSFDNIADFSSAGPTPDQRIKPDIVAPGRIKSAWSDGEYSATKGQCKMLTMSGTSMATTIVAGAAALIRQYFTDGYYPTGQRKSRHKFTPSAALIKASLLGGAFPMDGFTEAGLPLEPPPSFRQGYGRVLLERSIPVRDSRLWKSGWRMQVVDSAQLNTGESHNYCVRALGGPVKVTLVWTDYPASPTVQKALVNNLDLVVRSAGLHGRVLLGNGVEDSVNNVEQVSVADIPEGNIAITVKANFVLAAHGPQPYALVVHGHFNGILQSPQNPVAKPSGSNETCIITLAVIKSGPEGATRENSPKFHFTTQSGVNPLGGFECQLADIDGATNWGPLHDWKGCYGPTEYHSLPDKAYKFSVRPKGEDVIVSRSFQVDTQPPNLVIFGIPIAARSTQEDAEFEFAAGDSTPVTFQCRFRYDGPHPDWFHIRDVKEGEVQLGSWFPCSSPQGLHGIPYGNWVFEVQGEDEAGNESKEPAAHKWMTFFEPDTMYVRTIVRPQAIVSSPSFGFQVQAVRGNLNAPPSLLDTPLECSLQVQQDQEPFEPDWQECTSNITYEGVGDGTYQFQVRTQDPQGHEQDSVSKIQVVVDRTPPVVNIIQRPSKYHGADSVRIKFESTEEVVGYKCSLVLVGDPVEFQNCVIDEDGSAEYPLKDGHYVFQVSAEDHAGNIGKSEEVEFVVDSEPPVIAVKIPKPGNESKVKVEFDVMDLGGSGVSPANVSCLLRAEEREVSAEWVPGCESPQDYVLNEGRYVFNMRAVDRAGLHSKPNDYIIIVDKTPPYSEITSSPTRAPQPPLVAFQFVGRDKPEQIASLVDHHECTLLSFTPVDASQKRRKPVSGSLDPGSLGFNTSTNEKSTLQSLPKQDDQIQIKDGPKITLGKWVLCESPIILTGMASGFYKFQTRAIDGAGNVGEPTSALPFAVDDTLPIPGEDGSNQTRTLGQWVWILIGVIGGCGVLIIIVTIVACRSKSRSSRQSYVHNRNRRSRHRTSAAATYNRPRTNFPESSGSQDISSGASDDPMISLAIKASMQQQEFDGEERRKRLEREENARLQAAVQASMEDYQYQQAVRNSYQNVQVDNWGESLFPQPSAPPPVGDLTSTSPWALSVEEPNSQSWSSQNAIH